MSARFPRVRIPAKEHDFRPERSRLETSIVRLCPVTDRVRDIRAVLQLRVDTNRIDRRCLGNTCAKQ